MKKWMTLLLALCLLTPLSAQNKVLEKRLKKEYKTKKAEFEKEGWKLFGSSRSLDVALLLHYDKLTALGEDGKELVGIASRFKSKNVGKQMAINSACVTYAQAAGSHVKGRVVSELAGDGIDTAGEIDKFYAAYERLVEKEIRGEMSESFAIIRSIGNGEYEMQVFFIISEHAASEARIRAFEDAAKESEVARQHAKQVANFVREGFESE